MRERTDFNLRKNSHVSRHDSHRLAKLNAKRSTRDIIRGVIG